MFAPTVRKRSQRGQMRENERVMEATQKQKMKKREKKRKREGAALLSF